MPEGYTHIRTARQAAVLADYVPVVPKAFEAGANGPDILFCYQAWKPARRRAVDLPGLGGRMHDELKDLSVEFSKTVTQLQLRQKFLMTGIVIAKQKQRIAT